MSNGFVTRDVAMGFAAHLPPGRTTDDAVPDGVYWQVSAADGWIAGPIVIVPCVGAVDPRRAVITSDRPGNQFGDVTPDRPLTIFVTCPDDAMAGWVQVQGDGDLRVAIVAEETTPSGEHVELAARDQEPWWVAAADVRRVRVTGKGTVYEVVAFAASRHGVEYGDPIEVAGLDPDLVDRLAPVYAPALGGGESPKDRIFAGAPVQPVPYTLRQPGPGYTADDEYARVIDLATSPGAVADWVVQASKDRWSGVVTSALVQEVGDGQTLRFPVEPAIALAATDPGVARWLGRASVLPPWQQFWHDQEPTLAVALVPGIGLGAPPVIDLDSSEQRYDDALAGGYARLRDQVASMPPAEDGSVWSAQVNVVPLPFYPHVPPAIPRPPQSVAVRTSTWRVDENARTDGWERPIALQVCAPTGPVSLVRVDPDGTRTSTHTPITDSTAAPLLAAAPQPATPGVDPIGDPSVLARAAVSDPAAAQSVTWEIQLEDWIGRWSPPASVAVDPPAPARPATPTMRATLVRSTPVGSAPQSPGLIHLEISVAAATGPGAVPLDHLELEGDGDVVVLAVAAGGDEVVTYDFTVPATSPGGGAVHAFRVRAVATPANASEWTAVSSMRVDDARAVPAPSVSPRLVVAGRPGPAPEVELRVRVRAPSGAAFCRFYLADESVVRARVGLPGADLAGRPRAVRAAELLAKGLPPRNGFSRSVTVSVAGGFADGVLRLPSAAADLILVRPVFVTGSVDGYGNVAEGVETPLESVAPAYVIVPATDVPPLPRLTVTPAGIGKISVVVDVEGTPTATMDRLPGPLEARVVEVVPGQSPFYWPEVATLKLGADGSATTELAVPGWTRVTLGACVRYAAESVTVPGADLVVDPDLVALGTQPDVVVSPWGPVGAPVSADVVGAEPVVSATVDGADWQVSVSPLPPGRPQPGFRAVVYATDASGALVPEQTVAVDASTGPISVPGAATSAVVLVDPFGRSRDAVPVR